MGRDFPAADETGASDPFVITRCMGHQKRSKTKYETLNPGFFETLSLKVRLPPLEKGKKEMYPTPGVSLLVYDDDPGLFGGKKDLLGRVWIDLELHPGEKYSPVDSKKHKIYSKKKKEWYDLIFDATDSKEGKILVGYDIIPEDKHKMFPHNKMNI